MDEQTGRNPYYTRIYEDSNEEPRPARSGIAPLRTVDTLAACLVVGFFGIVAAVVGSLGPWVKFTDPASAVSVTLSGMQGDGKITLALIALCGAAIFERATQGRGWLLWIAAVASLAVTVVAAIALNTVSDRSNEIEMRGVISVADWGVWSTLVGAILVATCSVCAICSDRQSA
ncbi:hypothetical protein [Rhodococcus sp. UNC23MFCrub1.1]|uniref:hypothetical protein n=1 Tax=Rhodococcus sp. UNC23MFCrub1.1 TaxID=1449068 RepID=UPI0012DDCCDE|nr:hypothetical protein [Rhodococcus sp. UNC23MFCrub1.1]